MRFRPGRRVAVNAYGITVTGYITTDQPLPIHHQSGRIIPVRLQDGRLRFYAPEDVHQSHGGQPS